MKALVDKEWCGCLLFLLQVWSSPSEYHYNCNSFSLVALSLIAADFLSIKAAKCSKCGASQCTHSVHGYFPWKLFLGLNLKAPFFFSGISLQSWPTSDSWSMTASDSECNPLGTLLTSFPNLSLMEVSPKMLQLPSSKVRNLTHFLFLSL